MAIGLDFKCFIVFFGENSILQVVNAYNATKLQIILIRWIFFSDKLYIILRSLSQ